MNILISSLLLLPFIHSYKNPLDCFIISNDHALLGTAFSAPSVSNLSDCLNNCLRRPKCRSLLYYKSKNVCVLNSHTRDEKRSGFISTKGLEETSDYYERICYDKNKPIAKAATTVKNCFNVENGKVLIGIVDQQMKGVKTMKKCMKACEESSKRSDLICKSAMYYEEEQECILASQNKKDSPDLFIDDDKAIYIENNCLEQNEREPNESTTFPPTTTTASTTTIPLIMLNSESDVNTIIEKGTTTTMSTTTTIQSTTTNKLPEHLILPTLITLPDTTQLPQLSPRVEESGYVIAPQYAVTKSMASINPNEIIPAEVVDNYAVEKKKDDKKVIKTNKREPSHIVLPPLFELPKLGDISHKRRLRHPAVKDCFTEIETIDEKTMRGRVVKAYSLEQCVDICRLCNQCLRRRPCTTVAFNQYQDLCALSSEKPTGNIPNGRRGNVTYFARGHC